MNLIVRRMETGGDVLYLLCTSIVSLMEMPEEMTRGLSRIILSAKTGLKDINKHLRVSISGVWSRKALPPMAKLWLNGNN